MVTRRRRYYWDGSVPELDDFGVPIIDVFINGATIEPTRPWAMMTPTSHRLHGLHGEGLGQRYVRAAAGRWVKVTTGSLL